MSLHTRLIRRGAVYYFRARVPADLLDAYAPKKEIIFSLKTKDHKLALERVRLESVKLDQAFADARRKLVREAVTMPTSGQPQQASASASVQLSSVEVERLALLHLHNTLAEDEAARFDGRSPEALQAEREHEAFMRELHESRGLPYMPPPAAPVGLSAVELEAKRARARLFVDAAPAFLATGDTSPVRDAVNRLLSAEGLDVSPESPVYQPLCFAVLKSEFKAQDAILRRLDGEWIETPPLVTSAPVSSALSSSATVSAATADNPLFSEVWTRYLAERNPTDKTARDFGTSVRRFIEVNGDLPVQAISKAHVRAFKDAMLKMPAFAVSGELRNLPVPRLLAHLAKKAEPYKTLSAKTINEKSLAVIKVVLGYAVSNGYVDFNVAQAIRTTDSGAAHQDSPARLPYDADDLNRILSSPLFGCSTSGLVTLQRMTDEKRQDYQWLVLLGMFTGARLEELGQLDLDDVATSSEGVPHIFIHADASTGRSIKNRASRRRVPLHPQLIDLGFLAFVDERRKESQSPKLFRSLKSQSVTLTDTFSKWWGKYAKEIGVYESTKTYHSFRHTFKRFMRNAGVDQSLTDALQGHAGKSVSDHYGRDEDGMAYGLPVLLEALSKLRFEGVSFAGVGRKK